jgi:hypothetical protein
MRINFPDQNVRFLGAHCFRPLLRLAYRSEFAQSFNDLVRDFAVRENRRFLAVGPSPRTRNCIGLDTEIDYFTRFAQQTLTISGSPQAFVTNFESVCLTKNMRVSAQKARFGAAHFAVVSRPIASKHAGQRPQWRSLQIDAFSHVSHACRRSLLPEGFVCYLREQAAG